MTSKSHHQRVGVAKKLLEESIVARPRDSATTKVFVNPTICNKTQGGGSS